ncbi:MAG TPA: aminodeoxychorismate/anthranilate synthase component II [Pirellulaceae bacterium]|nr:aminodeoxychorismate/anthranilate synthase component II [Pirellulaceae bacterium]HMO90727.1 aminodeoxychorismate/anthranilate synthase component II [Pirellulaceae bacterium]HMP67978.1 aminodeoxychorismate/anthranilate synthase component II [Pirellulaceae bacterium]
MLLIIDNYDSFVFNLARYFRQLGNDTLVMRNNDDRLDHLDQLNISAIVIAPGPMDPSKSGKCLQVIDQAMGKLPLVGVCLGHQVIVHVLGGKVVRAEQPMHGRTSRIAHTGHAMFAGIASPFIACRYHSLVAERQSLPNELLITAEAENGEIMAFAHRDHAVFGVQFHPESALTQAGYQLLANILQLCSLPIEPTIARAKPSIYADE